ncbi:hypothetical protein [Afipia sp. 1NLS2]|uniref:hypothetical protein n=1 Tax=Afipia sp. 1NLS2 TaxID=666684 RepID=UPI0001D9EB41|nr:hypothetical protein [Afipia sp. 1NLS2]EFI52371.1 hypothetical protein AfiDRAFT_0357 [Afipia sp. 1NLS2]
MTAQDRIRERIRDPLKIGRFHDQVMSPFEGMGLRRGVAKALQALKASRKRIKLRAAGAALWIARNHDIEPDRSI